MSLAPAWLVTFESTPLDVPSLYLVLIILVEMEISILILSLSYEYFGQS